MFLQTLINMTRPSGLRVQSGKFSFEASKDLVIYLMWMLVPVVQFTLLIFNCFTGIVESA